jgi:biopolymer transport protein ExbD
MNLGRRNRVKAEGGMSSMTDLVFLMLIFFIIMSTMSEPGIPVDLPSGDSERTKEQSILNIGVDEFNMYLLDEDTDVQYTYEEIEPIIMQRMKDNVENNNIKISGDKNADYEFVFKLIALSKKNKWKPILVFK